MNNQIKGILFGMLAIVFLILIMFLKNNNPELSFWDFTRLAWWAIGGFLVTFATAYLLITKK